MGKLGTQMLAALALFGGVEHASPALADEPAPGKSAGGRTAIEEIVVTAEKRSSTVQRTPISITAISGKQLQERGITQTLQIIQETPGLSLRTAGPGQTELEARGLSSSGGSSPTVGFYLDDTPLSPPAAAQNGKVVIDPDLFDLNRVEVLRGPQGTLYGSGSMGGTVRLITNRPDAGGLYGAVEAVLSGTQGGGVNPGGNIMVNAPLNDRIALRIVATEKDRSGWIDRDVIAPFPLETDPDCPPFYGCNRGNVAGAPLAKQVSDVNTERLDGVRASVLAKVTARLTIDASVFWQRIVQGGYDEYDEPPGGAHAPVRAQAFDIKEPISDRVTIYSLTGSYDLDFASLTNATSYFNRSQTQTQDASEEFQSLFGLQSFIPTPFSETDTSHQFSDELRFASKGDGLFQYVAGLFYSDFLSKWLEYGANPAYAQFSPPGTNPGGLLFRSNNPYEIIQQAAFGEASWQFTDALKATVGVRYFSYRTTATNNESGLISETGTDAVSTQSVGANASGFNPKFNLAYEPNGDLTLYATAAKGFRPGGVNISVPNQPLSVNPESCLPGLQARGLDQVPLAYQPDTIWNYEVGEKARLFDGALSVNGDVYYIAWNNVQQLVALPCGYLYTTSAGTAHAFGPEMELTLRPAPDVTLTANGTYIDAQIDTTTRSSGLIAPLPLLNVPKYSFSLSAAYRARLNETYQLVTRIADDYVGPSTDTAYSYVNLPAYDLVNVRATLQARAWSLAFFIDNLTDKRAVLTENTTAFQVNIPSLIRVATNQPRTFGLDLLYHF